MGGRAIKGELLENILWGGDREREGGRGMGEVGAFPQLWLHIIFRGFIGDFVEGGLVEKVGVSQMRLVF